MALHAMEQGLHAASEAHCGVGSRLFGLVPTSERTKSTYHARELLLQRRGLWLLNMVNNEVSEITHAECAYLHDLRALLDATYYHDRGACENIWSVTGTPPLPGPVCIHERVVGQPQPPCVDEQQRGGLVGPCGKRTIQHCKRWPPR